MDAITEAPADAVEVLPPPRPWEALPEGTYAIVELMGHTTLVDRVTKIERFGAMMLGMEMLFGDNEWFRLVDVAPIAAVLGVAMRIFKLTDAGMQRLAELGALVAQS
jgi:hypothetical protein